MKCKFLLMTTFILIAIFNIVIGVNFFPIWAYVLVEIFSIFICVYLLINIHYEGQSNLENKINTLSNLLSSSTAEIKSQLKEQNSILLETIASNHEVTIHRISEINDNFIKNITEKTNYIDEKLCTTNSLIKVEHAGLNAIISDFTNNTKEQFCDLHEKIGSELEETRVVFSNNTDGLKSSIHSNLEQIQENLNESFTSLKEASSISTDQIQNQINRSNIIIQEGLSIASSDIIAKTNSLNETLTFTNAEIKEQMENSNNRIAQLISTGLECVSSSISANIDNVKQATNEATQQLLLSNKENSKSILQKMETAISQSESIKETINETSKDMVSKTESLGQVLTLTGSELKEHMESNGKKFNQLISTGFETISSSISTNICYAKQALNESAQQLCLSNKKTSDSILQNIDAVIKQGNSIKEEIKSASSDIVTKTESMNKTLKNNGDEMKKLLFDTDNKTTQLINKGFGNLSTSISNIDSQTSAISSLIIENIKDSDKTTEEFMAGLHEQYKIIYKELTSVQLKTHNIEEAVQVISQNESNLKIIESIQSHIKDLQFGFKNIVSEINNQLLDTQISQEATNNELGKLQVLLRTVLKSFEEKTNNLTKDLSKDISKSIISSSQKETNRTETIVDNETKNIVINLYKDDIIIKSTMKDTKGHKLYELEYVKGKIVRSRNYDKEGNINVEQTFYDNGQVHYRNEFTSRGKVTTEFDINGKKK